MMRGDKPASFPFFYVNPGEFKSLMRKFGRDSLTDDEIEGMDPVGNSPTFIKKSDLKKIAPIWADIAVRYLIGLNNNDIKHCFTLLCD